MAYSNFGMAYSNFSIYDHRCEICHAEISNIKLAEDKIQSKIGDRVQIIIEEHPWYKEAATICDIKNRGRTIFVRICILDKGKKVWVPNSWVEII